MIAQRRHFYAVVLIAMSMLMFETLLTRLFSVTIWYYFGVLAISLALLGIAGSGVLVYLRPSLGQGATLDRTLARAAMGFALTAIAAAIFHLSVSFVGASLSTAGFFLRLSGHIVLLTVPFFFGGLCLTLVLSRFSSQVGRLYFVDLVGSAIGCSLFVVAITSYDAPSILFLVAALALLSAILFQGEPRSPAQAVLLLLSVVAFFGNEVDPFVHIRAVKSYGTSSVQEQEAKSLLERWSPIARTTVFGPYAERASERFVATTYMIFNDAGAPTAVHRYRGSPEKMHYLAEAPRKLHLFLAGGRTLIIGTGGGRDVWAALATGATRVDGVELSPVTVDVVKNDLREFSGDIYRHPKVDIHVGDGRSFVQHTSRTFDSVELTMVDSWIGNAAGAFVFNENNLYTVEAFRAYYRRLSPTGVVSVTRYYGHHETLRIVSGMSEMLAREGIADPAAHMLVVRKADGGTVFAFRKAIDDAMAQRAHQLTTQLGGLVLWCPKLTAQTLAEEPRAEEIRRLLAAGSDPEARARFFAAHRADVTPTTDDRPFFFYTQKGSVFAVDPKQHKARSLAMPIMYGLFIVLAVLCVLFLVVPLLWARRRRQHLPVPSLPMLLYFACLGVGFMLVEVPLIQKFVLFLGHPTYSFTVVLSSLLLWSGFGSLLSERLPLEERPRMILAALGALLGVVCMTVMVIDALLNALLGLELWMRIGLTVLLLAPLGLLMGVPFPSGVRLLRRSSEGAIPWAWALNGVFSVLTTVSALLLALNLGFQSTLLIGTSVYALALVCMIPATRDITRIDIP